MYGATIIGIIAGKIRNKGTLYIADCDAIKIKVVSDIFRYSAEISLFLSISMLIEEIIDIDNAMTLCLIRLSFIYYQDLMI